MFFISFGNQYEKTKGKSLIYFDFENVIFFYIFAGAIITLTAFDWRCFPFE